MVTVCVLPAAAYGRGSGGSGIDAYQILGHSKDFPSGGLSGVKDLAESFQWSGGGGASRYSDCFALWPLKDMKGSVLVARFRDAGLDRLNRPHSLRLEVVLLDFQDVGDGVDRAAALLTPDAWPSADWSGPPDPIQLTLPVSNSLVDTLRQRTRELGRIPRTLVVSHRNYRVSDDRFELRISTDSGGQPASIDVLPTPRVAGTLSQKPLPHTPATAGRSVMKNLVLIGVFLVLIGITGWQTADLRQARQQLGDLNAKLQEKQKEINDLKEKQGGLESDLQQLRDLQQAWKSDLEVLNNLRSDTDVGKALDARQMRDRIIGNAREYLSEGIQQLQDVLDELKQLD